MCGQVECVKHKSRFRLKIHKYETKFQRLNLKTITSKKLRFPPFIRFHCAWTSAANSLKLKATEAIAGKER